MDLKALEKKLIATARATRPDERVPYAFEKRIMARLEQSTPLDVLGLWGQALWRAAVPCIALALLLSAWSLLGNRGSSGDFTKEFETAVLVAADQSRDVW